MKFVRSLVVIVLLCAVAAGAGWWWVDSRKYESTDDAQVEGHFDLISARIVGTVQAISPKIENNQPVEAGALLLELDPRDLETELERAKANLVTRISESRSSQLAIPIAEANAFGHLHSAQAAGEEACSAVRR